MAVGAVAVIAYCAVVGTTLFRFARRSWRDGYSYAYRMRLTPLPDDHKLGIERAFGVGGAFHYLLGVMMIAVLVTPWDAQSVADALILGVPLLGVVLSGALMLTIIWFNRPRFLVPRHMREQPGTVRLRRG
ncbi:hypothetical protein [Streptomyces sp. NBC_01198]|uniref:hypothetical protein n=1 Tax=Streptomyces sp. NBC_01198 TaxID=2903769 RepID=UPI002E141F0B|nr:hypothetical protein OG702_03625 [Streptomyces sp. NBC_01198]